jgi:hypothetical protein
LTKLPKKKPPLKLTSSIRYARVPINSIAPEAVNYFIFLGISSELSFVPERYEPATKLIMIFLYHF